VSLAVSAACSGEHGATRAAAELPHGQYVALGDSYSAGPGIPDQNGVPAGCGRSSRSYPVLVARSLRLKTDQVRDMSCGGATIADLSFPQRTSDGTNLAQLSALSEATTLVTIGISGNDIGFAPALTRCVELDVIPALVTGGATDLAPCHAYYTSGGVDEIQQKIQAAGERLAAALNQITNRAPHARVYVVGYPDLVPAEVVRTLAITQGDLTFLNDEELRLNTMLRERAEAAGAAYVDTYTPVCGPRRLR
jgi:lysophospholipase L1-like esterase